MSLAFAKDRELICSSRAVQDLRNAPQSLTASRKRSNTEAELSPSHRFKLRGIYSQDSPAQAEARRLRTAIQRRHRTERRAGREVSQTPTLSQILEPSPFDQQDDQQHSGHQQGSQQQGGQQYGAHQTDQQQGHLPAIRLGTPLASLEQQGVQHQGRLPPIRLGPAPQQRQQRQPHHPDIDTEIRDFTQVQDPSFTRVLDANPLSAQDEQLLQGILASLRS